MDETNLTPETNPASETEKHRHSAAYWQKLAKKSCVRFAYLFLLTVAFSVFYKLLINTTVFTLIRGDFAHDFVYCSFELLLMGVYWYYVFVLTKKSRHHSPSVHFYYLSTAAVLTAFSLVYLLAYGLMSRDGFTWLFRITLSFCGFTLRSYFPDSLVLLVLAYLAVLWLIMLPEPKYSAFLRKEQKFKANKTARKLFRFNQKLKDPFRPMNESKHRSHSSNKTVQKMMRSWNRLIHPHRHH